MTEFQEGDLVEAVKGEVRVTDRLKAGEEGRLYLPSLSRTPYIDGLKKPDWTVTLIDRPLPTEPGTVIAIGDWWLVRLRSYEGAPPAWELLPASSNATTDRMTRMGVRTQCIYGDEWVRAEVEQDSKGYQVISAPVQAS